MRPIWFVERVFVPIEEQYKYLSDEDDDSDEEEEERQRLYCCVHR